MREATRVSALYFLMFMFIGIWAPFAAPYFAALGLTGPQMGALGAVVPIASAFVPPLWGGLADRIGETTRPLAVAMWGSALALVPLFFTTSFVPLLLVLVVFGVFRTGTVPLVDSVTLTLIERQGGQYGAIRAWGSIGFVVASVVVAVLADAGLEHAVIAGIVVTQLAAAAGTLGLPRIPRDRSSRLGADLRELLARPLFKRFLLASVLTQLGTFGPLFFYPAHMRDMGLSNVAVGAFWWIGVGAEVLLFRGAARLTGRLGLGTLWMLSPLASIVRWAILMATDDPALILASQVLHALAFAGLYYASVTWLAGAVPLRLRASGQALFAALAFGVGGGASTLVSGWIVGPFGIGGVLLLGIVASVAVIPVAVPVVALMQRATPRP